MILGNIIELNYGGLCTIAVGITLIISNLGFVEGHLFGSDVKTQQVGEYEVRFLTFPVNPSPKEPVVLGFSVLDSEYNNIIGIQASVEIQKDGKTIFTSPKKMYEISDFWIDYSFPEDGTYEALLETSIPEESNHVKAGFVLQIGQAAAIDTGFFVILAAALSSIGGVEVWFWLKKRKKATSAFENR